MKILKKDGCHYYTVKKMCILVPPSMAVDARHAGLRISETSLERKKTLSENIRAGFRYAN